MRSSQFNRPALVRQLAGWWPVSAEATAPRQDLAERLGEWLNVADAIALNAVHQALPAVARAPRRAAALPGARQAELVAELQRVRDTLSRSITTAPTPAVQPEDTEFTPYHQRCLDQQRRMEMSIDALRAHLRQTLSATSPQLAQLAALDTTLDQMLGGREQRLLSGLPALLKQRFQQQRQAHPDTWPALFEHDFQQALLAELEHRLQPVLGMIEALADASRTAPN